MKNSLIFLLIFIKQQNLSSNQLYRNLASNLFIKPNNNRLFYYKLNMEIFSILFLEESKIFSFLSDSLPGKVTKKAIFPDEIYNESLDIQFRIQCNPEAMSFHIHLPKDDLELNSRKLLWSLAKIPNILELSIFLSTEMQSRDDIIKLLQSLSCFSSLKTLYFTIKYPFEEDLEESFQKLKPLGNFISSFINLEKLHFHMTMEKNIDKRMFSQEEGIFDESWTKSKNFFSRENWVPLLFGRLPKKIKVLDLNILHNYSNISLYCNCNVIWFIKTLENDDYLVNLALCLDELMSLDSLFISMNSSYPVFFRAFLKGFLKDHLNLKKLGFDLSKEFDWSSPFEAGDLDNMSTFFSKCINLEELELSRLDFSRLKEEKVTFFAIDHLTKSLQNLKVIKLNKNECFVKLLQNLPNLHQVFIKQDRIPFTDCLLLLPLKNRLVSLELLSCDPIKFEFEILLKFSYLTKFNMKFRDNSILGNNEFPIRGRNYTIFQQKDIYLENEPAMKNLRINEQMRFKANKRKKLLIMALGLENTLMKRKKVIKRKEILYEILMLYI